MSNLDNNIGQFFWTKGYPDMFHLNMALEVATEGDTNFGCPLNDDNRETDNYTVIHIPEAINDQVVDGKNEYSIPCFVYKNYLA